MIDKCFNFNQKFIWEETLWKNFSEEVIITLSSSVYAVFNLKDQGPHILLTWNIWAIVPTNGVWENKFVTQPCPSEPWATCILVVKSTWGGMGYLSTLLWISKHLNENTIAVLNISSTFDQFWKRYRVLMSWRLVANALTYCSTLLYNNY